MVLINRADCACVSPFFSMKLLILYEQSLMCIFLDVQYLYPHFVLSDCSVIVMLHPSP